MTTGSETTYDYDPYGAAGTNMVMGTSGNDRLFGGSGNDLIDAGAGSDDVKAGSGDDVMIYNLSANLSGAKDVYTGGSGTDTVRLQLTQAQWMDAAVRLQIERYVAHLASVQRNPFGEVSSGSASDFVFTFPAATTLTVQMTERLQVAVLNGAGQYVVIDHLAALITGPTAAGVTEAGGVANGSPGSPSASGDLYADDLNGPDDTFNAETSPAASKGGYGTYTVTSSGVWTYTLDNANAKVQAQNAGDTLTDTFNVVAADGTAQVVTISIQGVNDAAVITGLASADVIEAGGVANATKGTPTATGNLDSTDVDNPNDAFKAVASGAATSKGYGTYAVDAAGVWTYTLDNTNKAVQALNAADSAVDTFTVLTVDSTSQAVTVTIKGTNDAAVITGTSTGDVVEAGGVANGTAGTPTASGDLDSTDVDNPNDAFEAVAAGAGTSKGFGTYAVDAAGVWTYTLNNANKAVQGLNVGDSATDTFDVLTVDGTSQTVTVTIKGANDAAVITGTSTGDVVEAGGVANAIAGTPTANGDLDSTDVDNAIDAFKAIAAGAGTSKGFGTYAVDAAGVWTYTLDNTNKAVQALNAADSAVDTFTVLTVDGTSQAVTVTIKGTNDAAMITGTATGDVVEAGGVANGTAETPTANGDLDSTDVDNPNDAFKAVVSGTASSKGFGSYAVDAAGVWTYTLDNTNKAVQALNVGDSATDTFDVLTVDGTSQTVTVTIKGTNDAAVVTGTSTGDVVEAGGVANGAAGTPTANGDLDSTDVDNANDAFKAVVSGTASSKGYGSYAVDAAGVWTYTLDNTNKAVEGLNVGDSAIDTFDVLTVDGTSQTVTVTIKGTNDAAVVTGTSTGDVVEAGGVANGAAGTPTANGDLDSTDVDNANDAFKAVVSGTASSKGYGSYAVDAAGVWTYTLDNTNKAVQGLNVGDSATDTFDVLTVDGTSQTVTVTIKGANDAAVITGTSTGDVVEAGGVANAIAGTPTANGDLDSTDVDNSNDAFKAVASGAATSKGYGTYAVDAAGVWTYTLDNTNKAVQGLNVGDSATDTFDVLTVDGTSQAVTVTIKGTNDAALVTGTSTGDVVEAGGVANGAAGTPTASADLDSTDVDNSNDAFKAVAAGAGTSKGFGTYAVDAAGVWTYTLDNANKAVQALNVGDSATDTFDVLTVDGTSQTVTVTIKGTNDAAVITGTSTGDVVEAGGLANAIAGTPTANGDLDSTDVDNPNDAFKAVAAGAATTKGYGTYAVSAAGVWTYTLDDTNKTVQGLNTSDTATDTFSVVTADGTSQTVTVTIKGANDAAVIAGTTSGSVIESAPGNPGTPAASATLTDTDVDNAPNTFTAVTTAAASTKGYGNYTMTSGGTWTYTLDNSNATVDALATGATLGDTFTVQTVDGTSQLISITITGTTDFVNSVPTNITLGVVTSGDGLPNTGKFASLSTTDANVGDTHTYAVLTQFIDGVAPGTHFIDIGTTDPSSLVLNQGLKNNTTYNFTLRATDSHGGTYDEAFNIITGNGNTDTLPGSSGGLSTDDVLYGLNGSDMIFGGTGDDVLFGQGGDDTLSGGAGNDSLTGSGGNDRFVFSTALNGTTNVDTIADFVSGADKIQLTAAIFTSLPAGIVAPAAFDIVGDATPPSASTRLIYDASTGALSYDADGTGAGSSPIRIAVMGTTTHPTLASTDFVVV